MTMRLVQKGFISSKQCHLLSTPGLAGRFPFRSSPSGELSYKVKRKSAQNALFQADLSGAAIPI